MKLLLGVLGKVKYVFAGEVSFFEVLRYESFMFVMRMIQKDVCSEDYAFIMGGNPNILRKKFILGLD